MANGPAAGAYRGVTDSMRDAPGAGLPMLFPRTASGRSDVATATPRPIRRKFPIHHAALPLLLNEDET